jgi:tRNA nucleotidyltransferase (CCA-adding enzyme)
MQLIHWPINDRPSDTIGIATMHDLLPELHALLNVPQDEKHHPEGPAFIHTLFVISAARYIADRDTLNTFDRFVLLNAALCHDLGKATTTVIHDDGRITAYGHDDSGIEPCTTLLKRIGYADNFIQHVTPLVAEHMAHVAFKNQKITNRAIRRLIRRLKPTSLDLWLAVIEADYAGRPPLKPRIPDEALQIYTRGKILQEGEGL